MSAEDRLGVQEGEQVRLVEDDDRRQLAGDDPAERAGGLGVPPGIMPRRTPAAEGRQRRGSSRPAPALPPPPPYDIQTAHTVVSIDPDPSRPSGRMLFLDGHESSYVDLTDPTHLEFSYVRRIGDVLDLVRPPRQPVEVLHIGGGGFTLPRYVAATRPRSRQVVYEYDPGLVQVAREHLGLRPLPGLKVRVGDARERLAERSSASADVVVGDAFSGVLVPPHLATLEFAAEVRRLLRPEGVYVLNVIDCPPLRVSRAEAATLLVAFEHVALVAERDVLRERDAPATWSSSPRRCRCRWPNWPGGPPAGATPTTCWTGPRWSGSPAGPRWSPTPGRTGGAGSRRRRTCRCRCTALPRSTDDSRDRVTTPAFD